MKRTSLVALLVVAVSCAIALAQAPTATIDPSQHGALASAQQSLIQAWASISQAQSNNDDHLGGHAGRAKQFLMQANEELNLAAGFADGNGPPSGAPSGPPQDSGISSNQPAQSLTGSWTIYAEDAHHPGSSLKEIQVTQNGNILTGTFHGPNQHGKLQGWVSGNNVEFSTDTHDVLTFHGQITGSGMSGFYSVDGASAPWNAQRSN
jgi:hypothetical protein